MFCFLWWDEMHAWYCPQIVCLVCLSKYNQHIPAIDWRVQIPSIQSDDQQWRNDNNMMAFQRKRFGWKKISMDPRYLEFGKKEYIIHSSRPLRRDTLWLQIKWKQYDQSEEKVHNHFSFLFLLMPQ